GWTLLGAVGWIALLALAASDSSQPPLRALAASTWPLALAAIGVALYALREPLARGISLAHVLGLGTLALVVALELHARVGVMPAVGDAWAKAVAILPFALLLWASWRHPRLAAQPLADLFPDYRLRWFVPA